MTQNSRKSEFKNLDPALQSRIRGTLKIAGVWCGGVLISAAVFILFKPYIYKKRLERMKQPGYKPLTLKDNPPYESRINPEELNRPK